VTKTATVDPGRVVLEALRRYEPLGRRSRRDFLATLAMFAGSVPVLGQRQVTFPPQHNPKVMRPVNVHEIQAVAERNLTLPVYDYITGGCEDEYTLRGNVDAFTRTWLRRHVMTDVSNIDTSVELLGQRLAFPILLDPTTKNQVIPNGDRVAAVGAHGGNVTYCMYTEPFIEELAQAEEAPSWWGITLGHPNQNLTRAWARRSEDLGAKSLVITVDHQYTPNRDRNIRSGFGNYVAGGRRPGVSASLTWDYLDWMASGSSLPRVVKGILRAEDAVLAADHGADAIVVSNHGGRALDGAMPTLMALPEVVDAIGGRIPVLLDGGIRRGGDVLKALALGATAVLIGRPYVWGLAAFGHVGVTRVVEMLSHELKVAMGLAGVPNLAAIDRSLVRLPWEQ
jgi:isopentenyl diphosphate isomerase/L-lactate dehydrogenase-like FMN-dependent dehydrogenase